MHQILGGIQDPNVRIGYPSLVFATFNLTRSGGTSYFVSTIADMIMEPISCDFEVTIADGSKVRATHVGETEINFISDSSTPSTLVLVNVYFIPGLSRCLFSLQAFTSGMH
jgi:hypothetical protein